METGDFSQLLPSTVIYDPESSANGANRTPFPGNVIPTSRLDATAVDLLNLKVYWGQPTGPGITNNFNNNYSSGSDTNIANARVDHNIGDKQRIFARLNYEYTQPILARPYGTDMYSAGTHPSPYYTAVFGDTYTISPTVILDFRASFLRNHNFRYPDQLGIDETTIGWPAAYNTEMLTRTLPNICITNYDAITYCQGNPQSVIIVTNNVYQLSPSLTKVKGSHTMKFGMELRRAQLDYLQSNNNSGIFNFTNLMTAQNGLSGGGGYAFASFMLGDGASGDAQLNAATTSNETYQAFYFTDTFQVSHKLTLTYGLRWEGLGPFFESRNREAVLQPNKPNPVDPAYPGNVALVDSAAYGSRGIYPHPYHLFSPRLGVAYRLTDKWVIRSGAGINFMPTDGNIFSSAFGNPINLITTNWVPSLNGGETPYATLHNPFPSGILAPPQTSSTYESALFGQNVNSVEPNNPFAYTIQWDFSVQRELPGNIVLDVAYAGLKGVHLYRYPGTQLDQLPDSDLSLGSELLNQVPNPFYGMVSSGTLAQPTVAYGQLLRPFPEYTQFTNSNAASGNSFYNSLQVKAQKHFKEGGSLLAAFTKSKLMSDVEQEASFVSGVGTYTVQDYDNYRAERSEAGYDLEDTLVISYVYDIPMGKGHTFLGQLPAVPNKLLSGWGLNGITTFQIGPPLSFLMATNTINDYGGTQRPNVLSNCDKGMPGSAQSRLGEWFNTTCFPATVALGAPAAFTFGDESRTDPTLRAAGVNNFDFALYKDTHLSERFALQFRAEVFNLFNRVQFSAPNTTVGASTFGVVTAQTNNPRQVQLALRLRF
jgi:hypothetical protein